MDDETLLRRYAREGDEAAFRTLAQRYGGLVYAACLRDLRRPELAEDAAQGVFLVLARKSLRLRVRTTLVPWLYATAKLVSRGVLRAERRRPTVPLDESIPAPNVGADDALFQALDALSGPEREAVVLRFVQGLSLAEVGRAQGVSEDAARMRVRRALKRLRTEYIPALAVPTSLNARLAALALPKPVPLMTTPLLLTACGALVATGAAVAATRPADPAPPETPAKKAVVPQAKAFDDSKLKRAKPGPPPPKVAALDKPFTLVYTMTRTDLRTKAMKEAYIADEMRSITKDVDEDRLTQAQADERIAQMRAPSRPTTDTITIAYDGKTLFYEDDPGGDRSRSNINLFDGKHSFFFSLKLPDGKFGGQGSRSDGTTQERTWSMPFIGPSLPFFPVTRGGELLMISSWDTKLVYRGGISTLVPGPKGSVNKFQIGFYDPQEVIELSKWKTVQGRAVAGSIVRTRPAYWPYLAGEDMGKPEWRYEYTLVTARPSADPTWFSPDAYVQDGMTFMLEGGRKHFDFDHTKGTLDEQIARVSR